MSEFESSVGTKEREEKGDVRQVVIQNRYVGGLVEDLGKGCLGSTTVDNGGLTELTEVKPERLHQEVSHRLH